MDSYSRDAFCIYHRLSNLLKHNYHACDIVSIYRQNSDPVYLFVQYFVLFRKTSVHLNVQRYWKSTQLGSLQILPFINFNYPTFNCISCIYSYLTTGNTGTKSLQGKHTSWYVIKCQYTLYSEQILHTHRSQRWVQLLMCEQIPILLPWPLLLQSPSVSSDHRRRTALQERVGEKRPEMEMERRN